MAAVAAYANLDIINGVVPDDMNPGEWKSINAITN
jgi:hypothetical protein